MDDNSRITLTFAHADENGNLVIKNPVTHESYILPVTDELEQGIIAAKQTKRDQEGAPLPHTEKALPLSDIQTLIRAGHTPEEISNEYGVAVALVRRFAAPVETEKKFAIAQFLETTLNNDDASLPSSKVKDVIRSSMASLAADYSTIEWTVTRCGQSPWRVQATYDTSRTTETAEWMFNPRDHSVVCVNMPAKHLLGEISTVASPVDKELFSTDAVPVVTANIPAPTDAVSMSTGSFDSVSMNSIRNDTHMSTGAFSAIIGGAPADSSMVEPDVFQPHVTRENRRAAAPETTEASSHHSSYASSAESTQDQLDLGEITASAQSSAAQSSSESSSEQPAAQPLAQSDDTISPSPLVEHNGDTNSSQDNETVSDAHHDADDAKTSPSSKRNRSAIPAWDDILFGSQQ